MRAIFVLATILSFAAPQVSWSAMALSREAPSSWSLAAPDVGSQIIRAVASKTDKTFSSGFAIAADRPALLPPIASIERVTTGTADAPNLDLSGPPLAARPPPFS
jgi:hypothetical protein